MKIIFLDTETTHLENPRIIQLAFKERGSSEIFAEYFKPPVPIDIGAMATHHITEKKVADKLPFAETDIYKKLPSLLEDSILVAHNAKFDISVLENEGIKTPRFICTFKVAYRLYDLPQNKMQYLRYLWGIDIDEAVAHDAKGDVMILEKVFEHMLADYLDKHHSSEEAALNYFTEISKEPLLLKKFTFGKYRGKTFEEVKAENRSYFQWMLENMKDMDEDLKYTVVYHLSNK